MYGTKRWVLHRYLVVSALPFLESVDDFLSLGGGDKRRFDLRRTLRHFPYLADLFRGRNDKEGGGGYMGSHNHVVSKTFGEIDETWNNCLLCGSSPLKKHVRGPGLNE